MNNDAQQPLVDIGSPLKVVSPLENWILLVMALAIISLLIIFSSIPIARKMMVYGQLTSNSHASAMYATDSGLVTQLTVNAGDQIKIGDHLLTLVTPSGAQSIIAKEDGIVTQINVEANQAITAHQPLLFITAKQQDWSMDVFLPGTAAGVLNPGDKLAIRFDALPYKIHGLQTANVKSIAAIPMPSNQVMSLMLSSTETYYRTQLTLPQGCSMSNTDCQKWRLGMRLSAVVVVEKNTFIDRLLKPLAN